ncbi:MAG: glycosyl hydrolase [Candidatus Izemoplasmatales bacterium]
MKKILIAAMFILLSVLVSCTDDTRISTDFPTTTNQVTEEPTTIESTFEETTMLQTTEEITSEQATELPTTIVDTTDETSEVSTTIPTEEPTEIPTEEPTEVPTTEEPTTEEPTTEEPTTEVEVIDTVLGLEDTQVIVDHYFNPMLDVSAYSSFGKDITYLIEITGFVDYGTVGEYDLTYNISYLEDSFSATRSISIVEGTYSSPSGSRPIGDTGTVSLGQGSYVTGSDSSIAHPINATFLRKNLLNDAIPSSGWWTSLLVQNYGGSNGLYLNPLRVAFGNEGMEITNPLDGFVQYWNPEGYQTIAQFPIALKDAYLKSSDLNVGYVTEVIDYSDSMVKVAMKNNLLSEDEVVVTLVQGSPYVFVETANKNSMTLTMDSSVTIEYYNLQGQKITTPTHQDQAIIVKMVQRHSGYDTSPPANVGQAQYTDKYYLVNVPNNSTFTMNNNQLSMTLGDGNYLSIAAINDLSEAMFYHNHGYSMITDTSITYEIDKMNSMVYTDYQMIVQNLKSTNFESPLLALMPHQYKYSDALLSDYSYRTVRGTLKVMEGSYFQTILSFNGLLPGYTLPENTAFNQSDQIAYLYDLDSRTEISDLDNFYNDEGPYWNSKAIYPLAQGIIIADQLGEELLEISFVGKLKYLLADWYTYDGTSDDKYLFYNNLWGSVYYSNDDFATASTLSDHSFTHGYLIYGSAVLAMYDSTFVEEYGDMVELLLDDYMYPHKDDAEFAYLRNFDPWAGHSWAHGFGTFAEGNNLESTSEALNSWNAGYLWALQTGDEARMNAAIYGFVTEISAIKEYWFDYDEENWDPAFGDFVDVAGMVWGGKHDYATWFGANPTFIYGIQWLPTGEYLTNYALNDKDYDKLSSIYQTYLQAKNGEIDTWYSNMWAIQAIIDPDIAIIEFDSSLILNDDYPAELSGTYWMIHALDSLGRRDASVWMEITMGVTSTVYKDESNNLYAMIWNSSTSPKTIDFYNQDGLFTSVSVNARSFTKVELISNQ